MAKSISRRTFIKGITALGAGTAGYSLLAACGPAATSQPTAAPANTAVATQAPAPTTKPNVEITYWQAPIWRYGKDNTTVTGPGSDEWILDAIDRFQSIHPNIKVKMELVPWDQWGAKVTSAFANREVPNVLYGSPNADLVKSGVIDPIDDFISKDELTNWLPGMQDALTIDGHLYGIPGFTSPSCFALSKTALDKNGGAEILDKIGPNRDGLTFDMMKEYGAKFSDGTSRWFLGVPTDHGSVLYWGLGAWLKGWGVRLWDEKLERWIAHENPNSVKAIQWYVDAQNDWKILVPNLPKWSDIDNLYWNLNCAARYHTPGILAELEVAQDAKQAPKPFDIVLTTMPRLADVDPWISGSRPFSYSIGHEEDLAKREAAALFADWLGTDDSNATGWFVNGFFPPTATGSAVAAKHPLAADPNNKWVLDTYSKLKPEAVGEGYSYAPTTNARTAGIFSKNFTPDYFIQNFQSLLLGKKTAEQYLTEMGDQINAALA